MRAVFLALAALTLATSAGSGAAEIRSASDKEMATLLSGCWTQQITSLEKRFERAGYFNTHEICFLPHGKVKMWSVGGNKSDVEGFEAVGHFKVTSGRLVLLSSELQDGWLFAAQALSCDVLMVPGREMKLHNCVAELSTQREPDSSFSRKAS